MVNLDTYDLKEQVRSATDIVDLIGSYMDLRREGRNFSALCPWHDDSKPSLKVNPERQSWKCFVCDVGGDAFSFVMKRENIEFRDALELLAEKAGIEVRRNLKPEQIGSVKPQTNPLSCNGLGGAVVSPLSLQEIRPEP